MKSDWTIDSVISALLLVKEQRGNLPVELFENTKHGTLPKSDFDISVCRLDDRQFVGISNGWGDEE